MSQDKFHHRMIHPHQRTADRMFLLAVDLSNEDGISKLTEQTGKKVKFLPANDKHYNCWNKCDCQHGGDRHREILCKRQWLEEPPSWASSVKTSMNAMAITSSAKKLGPPTSLTALMTTSLKSPGRPSASQCSSFLCSCSTRTMDASTIAPMAMAMPPSDIILAVSFIQYMGRKEMIITIGIVIIGIMALGMCQSKMRITRLTIAISSMSVPFSVSIERSIRSARS